MTANLPHEADRRTSATILVVDDDPDGRTSICDVLSATLPGARIIEAATVGEARAVLGEHEVDLVLSDYQMPDQNGIEFLRDVSKADRQVGTILMTGYPALGLAVKARDEAQVHAVVVKPFQNETLLEVVQHALEKRPGFDYAAPR